MNNQIFTLELNAQEVDLVMASIGKMPLEQVIELYFNIRNQIAKAQMPPAPEPDSEPEQQPEKPKEKETSE